MRRVAQAITAERQHRHGDRSSGVLFCISTHGLNTFVEPTRANHRGAARKDKRHSETAERRRKAAGSRHSFHFPLCLSAFIRKYRSNHKGAAQPDKYRSASTLARLHIELLRRFQASLATTFCRPPAAARETQQQTEYF